MPGVTTGAATGKAGDAAGLGAVAVREPLPDESGVNVTASAAAEMTRSEANNIFLTMLDIGAGPSLWGA